MPVTHINRSTLTTLAAPAVFRTLLAAAGLASTLRNIIEPPMRMCTAVRGHAHDDFEVSFSTSVDVDNHAAANSLVDRTCSSTTSA